MTQTYLWRLEMKSERRRRLMMISMRRGLRVPRGFTLIEMLVVIVIIAILAAIAIPTYLMYRANAQDTAAVSLVRNGFTVAQTALAELGSYQGVSEELLEGIENNIDWIESPADIVTVSGTPAISDATEARVDRGQIAFFVESRWRMDLASMSESENWFGMQIDAVNQFDTGYIKVKVIDGSAEEGW
jgi:prepilin-type N-terminal cleavage/methylation domain-containing protein